MPFIKERIAFGLKDLRQKMIEHCNLTYVLILNGEMIKEGEEDNGIQTLSYIFKEEIGFTDNKVDDVFDSVTPLL